MKNPSSTAPSSAAVKQEIKTLSPAAQAYLYALDDELQRRRNTDFARGERVRQIRTAKLEAAVNKAIQDYRAMLNAIAPRLRAACLLKQMEFDPARYGLKKKNDGEFSMPDISTVRRIIREAKAKGILT